MKKMTPYLKAIFFISFSFYSLTNHSQITTVGSGSYTNSFPGVDQAGRNSFPSGAPQVSGNAVGKPIPTNDWWSNLIKENHASNLYNYPMALQTINQGLNVNYIVPVSTPNGSSQPIDGTLPVVVGVSGLNTTRATVSDFTDWTVTMDWDDNTHHFNATTGIAMPFLYFTKQSSDVAEVTVNNGSVSVTNEMMVITNSNNGSNYAIYAPIGSTWTQNGNTYTSSLNGKNYWSLAYIPTAGSITNIANEYKKYAYVFPANTEANWSYNESTSKLSTTFTVTTDVKEGTETNVLMGLLPHQWGYLAPSSAQPTGYTFSTIRGDVKTLDGNTFTVENTFKGILPTLPNRVNNSVGFNPADLDAKISLLENEGLATWTDSYNEGQVMNRLIQTARIADQIGKTQARDKIVATIKERLEDWLKVESGEVAFLFYYNDTWSAMLGYPAGHGQDSNLNDHHFHWGYFIHAAAFMEQYEPGWSSQWGDMINLLVRDAASTDRNDTQFPFLRNFSPYAGHSWANGFATFPFGNDQESSSESMQFAASLIHWGSVTNEDSIRDLGIYIYTTEQTAAEEYWFDVYERTFKPGYNYSVASRIWGNGYDNQTFWTSDIAAAYGIEMYPIHAGSLYLGHNTSYSESLWTEISANTGILSNQENPNLWHDTYWKYLSFTDPQAAIDLYDSYPDRELKFGISDAQTYHWLHAMNALGRVETSITANHPIAAVFNKEGDITYVAQNYSNTAINVTFSDGYILPVPAFQLVTSKDIDASGIISSDFYQAYNNGIVNLSVTTTGNGITKVEFYDGTSLLGEDTTAPYNFQAQNLSLGVHGMYARIYVGSEFNTSNVIQIQVGEQVPFSGTSFIIPGEIEPGNYDKFQGGLGQGISYNDSSTGNNGDYRTEEYVDATSVTNEGATIGWLTAGEWLEYSIDVQTAGEYDLSFRYASDNTAGGGPFYLEIDGTKISPDISVTTTNGWGNWVSQVVNTLELTEGKHILRVVITNGEFNLGKMTFTYQNPLPYNPPIANAGTNITVILPETTATLDGSLSSDVDTATLNYNWEQVYGPSIIAFDDNTSVSPDISNLQEGIYKVKLTVDDETHFSSSEVLVIVQTTANSNPTISITSPANNTSFFQGTEINIIAIADDLDGTVSLVEFFDGATKIGEDTTEPYNFNWTNASLGSHQVTAKVTDDANATATSTAINIEVTSAPSCTGGPSNGHYTYEFSEDANNPTLTFISQTGNAGNPTCLLYYGTGSGPYPGYNVTPNVPFQINASQGSSINFYYTYSYNGLQESTVNNQHTYTIGTCATLDADSFNFNKSVSIFPNPSSKSIFVKSPTYILNRLEIYSLQGTLVKKVAKNINQVDIEELSSGLYLVKLFTIDGFSTVKKLVKK